MTAKNIISIAVIGAAFIAGELSAQLRLDTRVTRTRANYSNRSKNLGNALDSNPMLGSGGWNNSRTTVSGATANSDMDSLVRGRGLSGFKGHAPSIENTLGSSNRMTSMENFERRSVSVSDVVDNTTNLTNPKAAAPYISREQGVMTTGIVNRSSQLGITPLTGNNRPDEQILRADKIRQDLNFANTQGGPRDVNRIKSMLYLEGGGGAMSERILNSQPGEIPLPTNSREAMQLRNAVQRTDGMYGAYGLTDDLQRMTLANQIAQFDEADEEQNPAKIYARIDPRVESRATDPMAELRVPEDGRGKTKEEEAEAAANKQLLGSQYRYLDPQMQIDQGDDAYYDLLMGLKAQQKARQDALQQEREKAKQEKREETEKFLNPEKYDPSNPENILGLNKLNSKDEKKQNIVFDKQSRIVIQDIAGSSQDLFNRYMNKAKTALKYGSYYDANTEYESATIVNPRNPLPFIGGALAKFGAGEWASAGYKLQVAFLKSPELTKVKFDLKKLLPSLNVKKQADAFENWLLANQMPSYRVLLLGIFIQEQIGNLEGAQRHAKALLKIKGSVPSVITKYAKQIADQKAK